MRIVQKITPKQIQRVKYMSLFCLAGFAMQLFTCKVADAAIESQDYEGPYLWNGEEYDMFQRIKNPGGYIDEYTNAETFCTSWVYHPGLSLLGDAALGICYLLFLFWLFIGISILADIFMEAIEVITSKSQLVQIQDSSGNVIQVEKLFWNPTIANLTLMALGSSAPEIILSVADTMGTLGEIPSELGPQAIVGSASFNLLVISAVSIVAVQEVKAVKMVGVFLTTAVFSTFAYVWFFLVLVVISPGVVEMWEACLTLGFMVALCLLAYSCDVLHSKGEDKEEKAAEEKRLVVKAAIRILAKKYGVKPMLQVGQGEKPDLMRNQTMSEADKANIIEYFSVLLTKNPKDLPADPAQASIEELLDCLQADNAVERIMYRKEVGSTQKKDFMKLEKGSTGQGERLKQTTDNDSKTVCFKSLRYEVAESAGYVTVTIEKKIDEDMSFWMRTVDGTATAGEDYEFKDELYTMSAQETSREVQIKIMDDPNWEPDEEFKVQLLDETKQKRLPGNDTECQVWIIDEDKPGAIGFPETTVQVYKRDQVAYIMITRTNGSDGEISCTLNTMADQEKIPGNKAARPGKDFKPIKDMPIVFKAGEVEHRVEIDMPNDDEDEEEQAKEVLEPEEEDTVSFALVLTSPLPEGVKLSKRSTCFVNIETLDDAEEARAELERRKMLDYFMSERETSWGQQFKIACTLGPVISQDNLIVEDVSAGAALWHFLAMFWKLFGALVPPRHVWGGWAAFGIALALIGIVTTIVGEVATVLGCVLSLKPSVTGITLVAMGTSLPDTFASMAAARSSDNADSAIGNVTGSNSVNVFLGMGLPWLIGCIYWQVNHEADYQVPPGSLSFSVIMFLSCSMVCFLVLFLRRCCIGGELGGEGCAKPFSALILFSLWLIYVIFVSLESYEVIVIDIGDIPEPIEY